MSEIEAYANSITETFLRMDMSRKDILEAATRCVCEERQDQYGDAESDFELIAKLWSAYLGCTIEAKDVATMMIMLKLARVKTGEPKADNWIDIAGYAACGGELESEKAQ